MRLTPAVFVLVAACGSSVGAAAPASAPVGSDTPEPTDAGAAGAVTEPPVQEESAASPAPAPTAEALKLTFPERGGVEAAIKAIPRGAPRLNMSDDALQGPLLDMRRYDRCKVPRTTKVRLTVAVYDGSAVGVDVETKPPNAKLGECLDRVVREMSWDKVPSLNQVTVSF
jgi:hypothetical protein